MLTVPLVYLEEYLDTLTAVPQQVQHSLGRLAELDGFVEDGRTKLTVALQTLQSDPASPEARSAVQSSLLLEIEKCAEKKAITDSLLIALSKHSQLLEDDLMAFQEDLKLNTISSVPKKLKQHHHHQQQQPPPPEECICNGKGRGEMISCENPNCPLEWFHLQCVGLRSVPAGKWFCSECLKH